MGNIHSNIQYKINILPKLETLMARLSGTTFLVFMQSENDDVVVPSMTYPISIGDCCTQARTTQRLTQ